jgi:hypothetical protein
MLNVDPAHLNELVAVVQRVVEEGGNATGFDAHAWTMQWLQLSVPALGGAQPLDYMGTADGRRLVQSLILQDQAGAYS